MPTGWYIVPYKRRVGEKHPARYPAIDDYTPQIYSEGGQWSETEILGNRCIVKVRANSATLTMLNGIFKRLPKDALNMTLSDLSQAQKKALRDELLDMGYTLSEIKARFGDDLGTYTLGDLLHFAARRRLKPHYDAAMDTIILDGPAQSYRSVDSVDAEVQ